MDDGEIDLWPQFFVPNGLYLITTKENHEAGLPIGIMRCVGRGMMIDRVKAFHTANIFEPHTYNHIIGYPAMSYDKANGCVTARSNFQVIRIMETGRMDLYATGKYLDVIQEEGGSLSSRSVSSSWIREMSISCSLSRLIDHLQDQPPCDVCPEDPPLSFCAGGTVAVWRLKRPRVPA